MQTNVLEGIVRLVIQKMQDLENYKIPIGVSNRHVHLTQSDLEKLFGPGYELTNMKTLKQPGQFAAKETVNIRGPKGEFQNVRILGPLRKASQIEISLADGFRLGVKAPIRESGKLNNTPGLEVIGPNGSITLPCGTIVALRHVHMTPEQAAKMGVEDKEIVEVETCGERRCILGNVLVRVSENFSLEMHVDMDEANACALKNDDFVILRKIKSPNPSD
ncbi:phosphate propanoyltransferase [Caproiciproducens faecalis]|uniref:Phosphate propanoyltransferase n=1 Tax=Caproiciproducens faecalis TaxID=2820301 RepID=A0ABS7DME3_9FIRM|nr:phosphate propanoyltransferase [Caproiciproducens faecalis]MBW7572279.1 phosphate propanoyltransferase [Caproiciproducens faecalis]